MTATKLFSKYIEPLHQNHLVERNFHMFKICKRFGQQNILVAVCFYSYEYTIVDHSGQYGTIRDNTDLYGIIQDHMGPYGTFHDLTRSNRTLLDLIGPYWTLPDLMGPLRDPKGPYGTIQDCTGPMVLLSLQEIAVANFFVTDGLTY